PVFAVTINGRGAYARLPVRSFSYCCSCFGWNRNPLPSWVCSTRRLASVLWLAHAAQAVLDSRGIVDWHRCLPQFLPLSHGAYLGPGCGLGMVRRRVLHRPGAAWPYEALVRGRSGDWQLSLILPCQQFRSMARR